MKLRHKKSCTCVECEYSRTIAQKYREKKRRQAEKVRKRLGIQYRREVLGRLVEDGMNSFYYSDKHGAFMEVNENLAEWLKVQIQNSRDAQERWREKRKRQ